MTRYMLPDDEDRATDKCAWYVLVLFAITAALVCLTAITRCGGAP